MKSIHSFNYFFGKHPRKMGKIRKNEKKQIFFRILDILLQKHCILIIFYIYNNINNNKEKKNKNYIFGEKQIKKIREIKN